RFLASLLSRKVMLGCDIFAGKRNTKIVLKLPDSGGLEGRSYGESSGPSTGTRSSTKGLPMLVPHRSDHRMRLEERKKKRKRLEEEDLQTSLTLSCEEAHRSSLPVASPEASMDPASLELAPLPILMVDVGADTTSLIPILIARLPRRRAERVSKQELKRNRGSCCVVRSRVEWEVRRELRRNKVSRHVVALTWVRPRSSCIVGSWDPPLERPPRALPTNNSFVALLIWRQGL
ncbi:hypothetical protein ACLOJK_022527, partial [Asimina triloba]